LHAFDLHVSFEHSLGFSIDQVDYNGPTL